jgi:hypothetical protein
MRSGRAVARLDGAFGGASIPCGGHVQTSRGNGRAETRHLGVGALPTAIQYSIALLAVILFLIAAALMPPSWRAILGVVFWLVVLPLGLLRMSTRWSGATPRHGTHLRTRPQPPDHRKN